jgi:hypothetical protein
MRDQGFKCVDCGKLSPPTEPGETITKNHGWRLARRAIGGVIVIEPRCPECHARSRAPGSPKKRNAGRG